MVSTGRDLYETPPYIYNKLDFEFHFTLDPCCVPETAKCSKYYTPKDDGLAQDWEGETVFCNPPYSKKGNGNPGQSAWVKKCYEESLKPNTTVVMLIPSRTDTKSFHDYILPYAEIRFIRGRLKFWSDGKPSKDPAAFPSLIAVFGEKANKGIRGVEM